MGKDRELSVSLDRFWIPRGLEPALYHPNYRARLRSDLEKLLSMRRIRAIMKMWQSDSGKLRMVALGGAAVLTLAVTRLGDDKPVLGFAVIRAELIRVTNGQRPVEGRLSWDFSHAPYPTRTSPAEVADKRRSKAENQIVRAVRSQPSSESFGALGIVYLLRGQTERAIQNIEEAVRQSPADARFLSDLAAALISRGRLSKNPLDLIRALEAADQALEAAPSFLPARFNRALALELLVLDVAARAAWTQYLEQDPNSVWSEEVHAHLAGIPTTKSPELALDPSAAAEAWDLETLARLAETDPDRTRKHLARVLLGDWADAMVAGEKEQARHKLDLAQRIARALLDSCEDHLPVEAVTAITRAADDPVGPEALEALIAGHRAYREAHLVYRKHYPSAIASFETAHRTLARGGSPLAYWATLYLAIEHYQRQEFAAALVGLSSIQEQPGIEFFPSLLGRIHWMTGLTLLVSGDPSGSLAAYKAAAAVFEESRESIALTSVHLLLAENYRYLGDHRSAWRHLHAALGSAREVADSRRRHAIFAEVASASAASGHLPAALYFRDEAVRNAEETGDPVDIAHALIQRSETLHRLNLSFRAGSDLARARRQMEELDDHAQRFRIEADLAIAESQVSTDRDPAVAMAKLTQALKFYRAAGQSYPAAGLYAARARFARAAGDIEQAVADYLRGIEDYEQKRHRISEEPLRISFFDRAAELFEGLLEILTERGEIQAAFDIAERGRARVLLDRLGHLLSREKRQDLLTHAAQAMPSHEIRVALPPHMAIVEYALLRDRTLVWVVRASELELATKQIGREQVEELVRAMVGGIQRRSTPEDLAASSQALYEILIQPLAGQLIPGESLFFVPDGALHHLPFAALRDPVSGRYLIEDHPLAVTPSATLYIRALRRDRELSSRSTGNALVVGNPRLEGDLATVLANLPRAESEAETIAELYSDSRLLAPEEATPARFLAAVGSYEIVHYAGHAVVNDTYPLLSYLPMASPGASRRSLLYGHDIAELDFDRTRQVVLSACSTADGRHSGEGVLSLARIFLAAGVPTVVAGLWAVEDLAAEQLLTRFHQALRAGADSASALRVAQLALLSNGDESLRSPGRWAPFQVYGGFEPTPISPGG